MNIDKSEIDNFDNYAHEWWNKRGPYKFIHMLTPLRIDYIKKNLVLKDSKILDLGCGGGLLAEEMCKSGAKVVGIDASKKTIEIAQNHAKEQNLNIKYLNEDIEKHDTKEKYDAVVCFELIEHVPHPDKLINQISRIIKPNGKLFISTINRNLFSFLFAKIAAEYILNIIPRGTHTYDKFLKPSEIRLMLNKYNLTITDIQGLKFNPIINKFKFSSFTRINYFITASYDD